MTPPVTQRPERPKNEWPEYDTADLTPLINYLGEWIEYGVKMHLHCTHLEQRGKALEEAMLHEAKIFKLEIRELIKCADYMAECYEQHEGKVTNSIGAYRTWKGDRYEKNV